MIAQSIIVSAIASLALLSGSASASAIPEAGIEARATSGINVDAACKFYHGDSFGAKATGTSCNSWVCAHGSESYGIDLNAWCTQTYGGAAYASCSGGVYNWVCNH
jgi:hypothetical protein